jgi:outer membrane autotransporter protein
VGLGLLARYGWNGGLYVEASARAGQARTKFQSGDLRDAAGNAARYRISAPYVGAHAGVGYQWKLDGDAHLDVSGKYLWNRQSSDSARVLGDRIRFDADNSRRARVGARYVHTASGSVAPYAGLAYEYEFDGKARAGAYGYDFAVPSLKGGTRIAEIGVRVKPTAKNTFLADIGLQGYTGQREGFTGWIRGGWSF